MTDINLLVQKEKRLGNFLNWVLTYGRYIIIGTEIIVLLAFLSRFKLDRELTDLHEKIEQKQAIILASSSFENEVREIQKRLEVAKKIIEKRKIPGKILNTLNQLTPQDIILKNLSFDQKKLSLTAISFSNDGFNIFLNNLSSSSIFEDISLDDVGKSPENAGIEFKISTVLKNL